MIIRTMLSGLIYLSLLTAQYSQEREVPQDLYEKGILYFDVNETDSTYYFTPFVPNSMTGDREWISEKLRVISPVRIVVTWTGTE